jgi:hypothetical protein
LHYPIKFSREEPAAACLPSRSSFQKHHWPWNPNLRTILDPAGLLRCFVISHSQLATTTKPHRQLAVFPNSHTHNDPRNNRQPAERASYIAIASVCRLSPRKIAFSEGPLSRRKTRGAQAFRRAAPERPGGPGAARRRKAAALPQFTSLVNNMQEENLSFARDQVVIIARPAAPTPPRRYRRSLVRRKGRIAVSINVICVGIRSGLPKRRCRVVIGDRYRKKTNGNLALAHIPTSTCFLALHAAAAMAAQLRRDLGRPRPQLRSNPDPVGLWAHQGQQQFALGLGLGLHQDHTTPSKKPQSGA